MNAKVYRMVTDNHVCPFGIKALDLLKRKGYDVEDNHLKDREETDVFKEKYDVKTTPQVFIEGERIGGFDALAEHLNISTLKQTGTTYQPVIAVFATTFFMAVSHLIAIGNMSSIYLLTKFFVAYSMCALAILKLRDLYTFSNQFVTYDIFARRYVPYAYIYPFLEVFAGIGMISGHLIHLTAAISFSIGLIGSISVIKAVYIEKRDIKCACVGGDTNVPLGAISLTENLMMVLMAIWMVLNHIIS